MRPRFVKFLIWIIVTSGLIVLAINFYFSPPRWISGDAILVFFLNLPALFLMILYLYGRNTFSLRVLLKISFHLVVLLTVYYIFWKTTFLGRIDIRNLLLAIFFTLLAHYVLAVNLWRLKGLSSITFTLFLSIFANIPLYLAVYLLTGHLSW